MSERNDILEYLPDRLNDIIRAEIEEVEDIHAMEFTTDEIENALQAVILKQYVVQ